MTYTDVSVWLTGASVEASQLAGRLGGICTEERQNVAGIEQVFRFNMESFAQQFNFSAFHFPEVISIGRSPNLSQKAITESRLCNCGWTTKSECDQECSRPISIEVEGDRHE